MTSTMTPLAVSRQAGRVDDVPDPEVPERARRRTYTAKYKRDVLAEYEAADQDQIPLKWGLFGFKGLPAREHMTQPG